jgi:hypothetical protein
MTNISTACEVARKSEALKIPAPGDRIARRHGKLSHGIDLLVGEKNL